MTTIKKLYLIQFIFIVILCNFILANTLIADDNTFQNLYSSRLSFNSRGEPVVGIGLMSGKDSITLQSDSPANIYVFNPKKRTITYASAFYFNLVLQSSKPAEIEYYAVAEMLESNDPAYVSKMVKFWDSIGLKVKPKSIGTSFSVNGRIIDNTKVLLYFLKSRNLSKIEGKVKDFNRKNQRKAFVVSEASKLPSGKIGFVNSMGDLLASSENIIMIESTVENGTIYVKNCEFGQGFSDHGFEDRKFSGTLYAAIDIKGKLTLGNLLSIEDVLKSTVPSETFPSAPMEALKAQAVAARGQLLSKLGTRHLSSPYHLCSTQHCQVYKGEKSRTSKTDKAVEETYGEFLIEGNHLVDTTYSASAGGYTENNENTWHQQADIHRRGRLDAIDENRFKTGITEANLDDFLDNPPVSYSLTAGYNNDKYRWQNELSVGEATYRINKKYPLGRISDIKAVKRGVSGRINTLEITGKNKSVTIHGELNIRRLLGNLPSSLFRIRKEYDEDGNLNRFIFKGAGYGHGVGMCQTGSIGRAKAGQNYHQILSHYYNGAKIEKLY